MNNTTYTNDFTDESPTEKKEAQLYSSADLFFALSATRKEPGGISIAEVAKAFQEAQWDKAEVESLMKELTQRYE